MKKLIFIAATLIALTSCGKKDEPVVNTSAAATVPSCPAGQVWNGSSCVIGQTGSVYPGQPYTGQPGYTPYYPSYPQMCGGGYPQYPGQYPYCQNFSRYRWYSYNGFIFYYAY